MNLLNASEAILQKNKTVPLESQGEISHAACLKKKKKSLKTPEDTLPSSSPLYKRFLDPARRQQKGITDFQREINSQSVRSVASIWIFRLVFIVLSSRLS